MVDFKNEDEVKEYLKNLYTEYTFGCCSEKKPEVCHLLGDYEEAINEQFKKAAEIYQNNCDEFNFGRSCTKFGGYKYYGRGCKKDLEEAYNYFKKGCELGDGPGCTFYGMMNLSQVQDGKGTEEEKRNQCPIGIEALKKACYDYKHEKGCFMLGSFCIGGIKDYLETNFQEAYKAMTLACEYANPQACANVARMLFRGDGVEKDEEKANSFKERALELQEQMNSSRKTINFQQGIS